MGVNVYEIITDTILKALDEGVIPWRRPWSYVGGGSADGSLPKNLKTGRPYRGINVFILSAVGASKGYRSNYWITFKQAQAMGGHVRKGEKSTPCALYKRYEKDNPQTGKKEDHFFLMYFNVFNVEQCDGLTVPSEEETDPAGAVPSLGCAKEIVDGMPQAPEIRFGGDEAFYHRLADYVQVPALEAFESEEKFWSVQFHELAHSTGHPSRLGRFVEGEERIKFGSNDYSFEELVAEFTAAFLCGKCGIDDVTIDNSAAYIKGWASVFKKDKRILLSAASKAQKAADFILGKSFESEGEDEGEAE